jgi:hypothetical protein
MVGVALGVCVAVGVADGVGARVGVADGDGVGLSVSVGVGDGAGVGVTVAVDDGVGNGVAVAVGDGVGVGVSATSVGVAVLTTKTLFDELLQPAIITRPSRNAPSRAPADFKTAANDVAVRRVRDSDDNTRDSDDNARHRRSR